MSFSVKYSPRARHALKKLPIELQEAVIDEVDKLASAAPQLGGSGIEAEIVRDFVRELHALRHYLCLLLEYDHDVRVVEILEIGHCELG